LFYVLNIYFIAAMAVVCTFNGHNVTMYMRGAEQAESINNTHRNSKRFSDIDLPVNITATNNFEEAVAGADIIIHAVPAQHTASFVEKHAALIPVGVPYVSTAKGIDTNTHR